MIFGIGYVKQYVLHWDGGYIEMLLFNDDPLPYCLPRHVLYGSFFEISPFKLLWAQSQNLLETHFKK